MYYVLFALKALIQDFMSHKSFLPYSLICVWMWRAEARDGRRSGCGNTIGKVDGL